MYIVDRDKPMDGPIPIKSVMSDKSTWGTPLTLGSRDNLSPSSSTGLFSAYDYFVQSQ